MAVFARTILVHASMQLLTVFMLIYHEHLHFHLLKFVLTDGLIDCRRTGFRAQEPNQRL